MSIDTILANAYNDPDAHLKHDLELLDFLKQHPDGELLTSRSLYAMIEASLYQSLTYAITHQRHTSPMSIYNAGWLLAKSLTNATSVTIPNLIYTNLVQPAVDADPYDVIGHSALSTIRATLLDHARNPNKPVPLTDMIDILKTVFSDVDFSDLDELYVVTDIILNDTQLSADNRRLAIETMIDQGLNSPGWIDILCIHPVIMGSPLHGRLLLNELDPHQMMDEKTLLDIAAGQPLPEDEFDAYFNAVLELLLDRGLNATDLDLAYKSIAGDYGLKTPHYFTILAHRQRDSQRLFNTLFNADLFLPAFTSSQINALSDIPACIESGYLEEWARYQSHLDLNLQSDLLRADKVGIIRLLDHLAIQTTQHLSSHTTQQAPPLYEAFVRASIIAVHKTVKQKGPQVMNALLRFPAIALDAKAETITPNNILYIAVNRMNNSLLSKLIKNGHDVNRPVNHQQYMHVTPDTAVHVGNKRIQSMHSWLRETAIKGPMTLLGSVSRLTPRFIESYSVRDANRSEPFFIPVLQLLLKHTATLQPDEYGDTIAHHLTGAGCLSLQALLPHAQHHQFDVINKKNKYPAHGLYRERWTDPQGLYEDLPGMYYTPDQAKEIRLKVSMAMLSLTSEAGVDFNEAILPREDLNTMIDQIYNEPELSVVKRLTAGPEQKIRRKLTAL